MDATRFELLKSKCSTLKDKKTFKEMGLEKHLYKDGSLS